MGTMNFNEDEHPTPKFTPRQQQIMQLAANGLSSKEIAASLGLSVRTVETHLERLYRKNRIRNRGAAIASWLRTANLLSDLGPG